MIHIVIEFRKLKMFFLYPVAAEHVTIYLCIYSNVFYSAKSQHKCRIKALKPSRYS
jgi:hypothetical protein